MYRFRIPTWDPRRLHLKNVKKGAGSDILPLEVACSSFQEAGRTPRLLSQRQRSYLLTAQQAAHLHWFSLALKCHQGDVKSGQGMLCTWGVWVTKKTL